MDEATATSLVSNLDMADPPALLSTSFAPPSQSRSERANFYRSAKWCPDGIGILSASEACELQVHIISSEAGSDKIEPSSRIILRQPSPILDYTWYPAASLSNLATFCFVASVRECPIKLLDATDGRHRASYKLVDHRERFIAPHCMAFDLTGTRLYCGFEDAIEVFDVQQPGEGFRIPTIPTKKSKDGLKGIISSVAFCPDYSGTYAVSSLNSSPNSSLALFSEGTGGEVLKFCGGVKPGGLTQVQFNPIRTHILYASSRRSSYIQSWDLRNTTFPVDEYFRNGNTNQKMRFDVSADGRWIVAGDTDGMISAFDADRGGDAGPVLKYRGHEDAIGSITFAADKLLSVSGSRHFDEPSDESDSSQSDNDLRISVKDSSMKLWQLKSSIESELV